MRTHYENLKISENAPPEVVSAAYRALSKRHHPDKNPGNPDADKIMRILNEAYEVLSDPARREDYDERLQMLRRIEKARASVTVSAPAPRGRASTGASSKSRERSVLMGFLIRIALIPHVTIMLIVGMAVFFGMIFDWISSIGNPRPISPKLSPRPAVSSSLNGSRNIIGPASSTAGRSGFPPPAKAKPEFVRPTNAPNGYQWPGIAAYLHGYPVSATGGRSSVMIDNTQNSSDVFLKLVSIVGGKPTPARCCFIPAYSRFTFGNVLAGTYDVRYQDLESGGFSKTDEFTLAETRTYQGFEYSEISLTLYKVLHGNMEIEEISEAEF